MSRTVADGHGVLRHLFGLQTSSGVAVEVVLAVTHHAQARIDLFF